ncbi:hypothetical protein OC25_02260 [Pedobacter kyungheensis]|uniref:AraC family transcriptional regulator n=1 Tax=Pedobacter kyungheensis TaxID=1069985 RepID=A0A0C1DRT7_9SPHI|nr:helix-turn-helix domain-containing protein [Pedobacter kyungheensis]KIA96760.1 hypothetical protein OC25_02260 [Pedobacter kyungheensis]
MESVKILNIFDLDYLTELMPDLVCIVGRDRYFKKMNFAVTKLLGYEYDELLTQPLDHYIHPEDVNNYLEIHATLYGDRSVQKFENRLVTKQGQIVWLFWTAVYADKYDVIFCIAKELSYRNVQSEADRISTVLSALNAEQIQALKISPDTLRRNLGAKEPHLELYTRDKMPQTDQHWLGKFELAVRQNRGSEYVTLATISSDLAMSERQLHRQVKKILGITPNKLVRMIRMQMAWEAIASGKYRTVTEIANVAGYASRAYFQEIFNQAYGIDVSELL